jgi:uncharacterized RmlC-like cupin family protein
MPEDGSTGRAVRHVPKEERRADTQQSPGMLRFEGISGRTVGSERIWLGENHVGPHIQSANHHHGESESAIFVVSGNPVFVYSENGVERRIEAGPGDYVFVPPFLPHREENPGTEEAFVVLARSTQEAIVVNVAGLDDPVEATSLSSPSADVRGDDWHRTEVHPEDKGEQ